MTEKYNFDMVVCTYCLRPVCSKITDWEQFLNNPFWCHCKVNEQESPNIITFKATVVGPVSGEGLKVGEWNS